ncbi:MAG: sodium-dependent bicarbonate transport family permease [Alphaproteobacteria bacterium]
MIDPQLILATLTSPAVMCFVIGALAALIKSDLRVPAQVHESIAMYLLFSIGLKGGIALSNTSFSALFDPMIATLVLGILTPVIAFVLARRFGRLSVIDAAAVAAHFGSVSAVTFMAALNFANQSGISFEGFMTALLVLLEIPGIVIALALAGYLNQQNKISLKHVLHDALTGKSVVLLTGGLLVGLLADRSGVENITHVFIAPFQGVLVFFLLEMGVVAASRFREARASLPFMLTFGTLVPLLFGLMGVVAGELAGLSAGGAAILATMAASASYIAAPAAVKMALPQANPGLYLTMSISITLPFNIALGIPLYFAFAEEFLKWLG